MLHSGGPLLRSTVLNYNIYVGYIPQAIFSFNTTIHICIAIHNKRIIICTIKFSGKFDVAI